MIFVVPSPLLLLEEPSTYSLLMMTILSLYGFMPLNPRMRCLENFENSKLLLNLNVNKRSNVSDLMGKASIWVMLFDNFSALMAFFDRKLFPIVLRKMEWLSIVIP